ncbi:hypothetical protein D9758_004874 [Tetrapyrgos nigripes]|uniref:Peptidase S53 domain-containing protein n=1 Tax=Tetrapyrgos nigripes TaxID=182062 RepID=A0A8H5G609_9AGAR|nr:hypothetical protein D9758_004874 [Tetrapyrgos nigripes]
MTPALSFNHFPATMQSGSSLRAIKLKLLCPSTSGPCSTMRLIWFGLGVLARFTLAAPSLATPKVKHSIREPNGWTREGLPSADHLIELRIGLNQPNIQVLEDHLLEISDPDHYRYGQHLSKQEVEDLAAPHEASLELVNEWLASHGIQEEDLSRSPARDWVIVKVPVTLAESMLDTTYHVWKHSDGDYLVRTTSYSLPEHLHEHVDLIQPTTMFARWKGMKSTIYYPDNKVEEKTLGHTASKGSANAQVDPSCNTTITIDCLKQLYNIDYTPQVPKKNSIGITGYLEEFANIEDLQSFYAEQLPEAVGTSFKFVSVNGGINDQNLSAAGIEANLDVQFAYGLSFPTPGTFWSTAGRPPFKPDLSTPENTNEPYNDWLDFVLAQHHVPLVISSSYGDSEQTVPEEYARRACTRFAELSARGVTLTFSSGDGGVGDGIDASSPLETTCISNDVSAMLSAMDLALTACQRHLRRRNQQRTRNRRLLLWRWFQQLFPRPAYQEAVVSQYLANLPKGLYDGLYNPAGRAAPDVAAQGRRFRVWVSGQPISIGGTSASSPTFAAVVALLNDARIAAGLPSLGFLNPLLYKKGLHAFNDITIGNNPGCKTDGFNATVGWDPVTGLGTPNFKKLKDVVLRH